MLAAIAALGLSAISTEARARTETERGSFSSTGVDDDARGKVKLKVRNSSDGRFEVQAQKLDSSATYEVLVDGVLVGRFTTLARAAAVSVPQPPALLEGRAARLRSARSAARHS